MYVPRWLVLSVMVAAATLGGWLLHGFATDGFSLMPDSQSAAPGGTPVNLDVDGGDPKPVINLTLNSPGSDTTRLVGRANSPGGGGAGSTRLVSTGSSSGQTPIHLTVQADPGDSEASGYGWRDDDESFVSNDSRITVNGNNIVVASDGSIVFQGDNGTLDGNTGNSSGGGTIAIDNEGSSISTGTSSGHQVVSAPEVDGPAGAGTESSTADSSDARPSTSVATDRSGATITGTNSKAKTNDVHAGLVSRAPVADTAGELHATGSADQVAPLSAARSQSPAGVQAQSTPENGGLSGGAALLNIPGRSVSISGYEDHSITVDGNDQIILYDDSNVFINRNGQVNANTGDTDSSGLNVVDAVDSVVRSGNSGDGEGSGEDEEEDEDADEAPPAALQAAARGVTTPVSKSQLAAQKVAKARTGLAASALSGQSTGSVDDEDTSTTATGDDVLVIGGDGYDDLAIRSRGNGNTVVYDDSNLVIGGTGGVNAQIGDSDTGGAVVMGVRNSLVEAGCEGDLCPLYDSGWLASSMASARP